MPIQTSRGRLSVGLNASMIAGLVTVLTGVSYLTETYGSPAFLGPFSLLDFLPWWSGQTWWGLLHLLGGVLLLGLGVGVRDHRVSPQWRILVASFGAGVWAVFGTASGLESLFGPQAASTGSRATVTCFGMVLLLIWAARSFAQEAAQGPRS